MEDESYHYRGKPVRHEVARLELCSCYTNRIFEKYNASAGMKPHEQDRTFQNSKFDQYQLIYAEQAFNFAAAIKNHLEAGAWLYIYGDDEEAKKMGLSAYGTGKSHLTHCIGNKLTEDHQRAIYVTEDKLYQDIKSTYNRNADESEMEVMYRYENVPILLIDDMFKSKTTDWVEDKAFHLLNNRNCPGKVTIINSNYSPNRIELALPKNGKAIASRIFGNAILMPLIGIDRRQEG